MIDKNEIPLKHRVFENKIDKIKASYLDEGVSLTAKETEIKARWEMTISLMTNYKSHEDVIKILKKKFKISQTQAYTDIRNVYDVYGNIFHTNQQVHKYILYEYSVKTFQKAKAENNTDQMNRAISNMIKITGVDRDEAELPDPSKINPPKQILQLPLDFLNSEYVKVIDPKAKEEINKVINKVSKILNDSLISNYLNVIDIPHIDMTDND